MTSSSVFSKASRPLVRHGLASGKFNSTEIQIGMKKYTPVALAYIVSYVLVFIARSVFEKPAVFLVGLLVTACLCVSVCRRIILAILLWDQAWKYGGK